MMTSRITTTVYGMFRQLATNVCNESAFATILFYYCLVRDLENVLRGAGRLDRICSSQEEAFSLFNRCYEVNHAGLRQQSHLLTLHCLDILDILDIQGYATWSANKHS